MTNAAAAACPALRTTGGGAAEAVDTRNSAAYSLRHAHIACQRLLDRLGDAVLITTTTTTTMMMMLMTNDLISDLCRGGGESRNDTGWVRRSSAQSGCEALSDDDSNMQKNKYNQENSHMICNAINSRGLLMSMLQRTASRPELLLLCDETSVTPTRSSRWSSSSVSLRMSRRPVRANVVIHEKNDDGCCD